MNKPQGPEAAETVQTTNDQAVDPAATCSAWLPIETAPKDKTMILLASSRVEIGNWDDDKYARKPKPYWNRYSAFGKTSERENNPTHWMPLPSLPNT